MCGVFEYVSIEPCHHRDEAPQTRHGMCAEGLKLAANVRVGQIVAGECANETEPYILFKCLGEMYTVTPDDYETNKGVYKHNWMGEVRPDDAVIKGLKLSRNRDGSFTDRRRNASSGCLRRTPGVCSSIKLSLDAKATELLKLQAH